MEECTREEYEIGTFFYRMNQTEDFIVNPAEQQSDWGNCIYFFLTEEDRERYNEHEHGHPITLRNLQRLPYIKCTYECFNTGDYNHDDMNRLFREIETLIGGEKPDRMPFLQWLGTRGYAFQCYNEGTWEIAIPVSLLSRPHFWEIVGLP